MKKILTIISIFVAAGICHAQVPPLSAITNVYLGTGVNTGTGDPAVTAFAKENTNTLILSNAVAQVTATSVNVSSNSPFGTVNIQQWGAYVDGRVFNNCYATNGTTLIDPYNRFTASMVGLYCWMRFAGTNGVADWLTTVSAFNNSGSLSLTTYPPYLMTNEPVVIGHDDSTAWQNAFNYYGANYQSVRYFVPLNPAVSNTYGISMICDAPQDQGDWTLHWNAQVHAPNMPEFAPIPSPVWTFQGAVPGVGGSTYANRNNFGYIQPIGSVIMNCWTYGNNGSNVWNCFNFAQQTGGNSFGYQWTHSYTFNDVAIMLRDIHFLSSYNNNEHFINANGAETFNATDFQINPGLDQFAIGNVPNPSFTNTAGLDMPGSFCSQPSLLSVGDVNFFYNDLFAGENMDINNVNFFGGSNAVDFADSGGNLMKFDGVNQMAGVGVGFNNFATEGTIWVDGLNFQPTGSFTNFTIINDPGSFANGSIKYEISASPLATTNQGFAVYNPYQLDIINCADGGQGNVTTHGWLNSGQFRVGGSLVGGFPQPLAVKYYPFMFYSYSNGPATLQPGAFMATFSAGPNNNNLILGGPGGGNPQAVPRGENYIHFATAANENSTVSDHIILDPLGNFTDQDGGNTTGWGLIAGQQLQASSSSSPRLLTLNDSAGSSQGFISWDENNLEVTRTSENAFTTGPNYGWGSWSVIPIGTNGLPLLPSGYYAFASETNGGAEVYSNLWINNGSIYVTNGAIAIGQTASYAAFTNGLQAGTHVFWNSNSTPSSPLSAQVFDILVDGTSTTVTKIP